MEYIWVITHSQSFANFLGHPSREGSYLPSSSSQRALPEAASIFWTDDPMPCECLRRLWMDPMPLANGEGGQRSNGGWRSTYVVILVVIDM